MADLKRYREKRDANATPEPFGLDTDVRPLAPGAARAFVIQQHAARSMHWDFRIEIDGVLVSFAIPKGPTLDSKEKRFAAQTEDHPMEYADFEGVIPKGNYGAGAMIVWERGSYFTVEGRSPAEGLAAGKLDLILRGHKLRGRFGLVRMKGEGGKSWLWLSKWKGTLPDEELVLGQPESVMSGLTVAEVGAGVTRDEEVSQLVKATGAPARALPEAALDPMLAESEEDAFTREGWLFELKYDGARVLAMKSADAVRLVARSGRDVTGVYPEITRAVRHLPVSECVIDGEVVALDERGRASFELLQPRFRDDPGPRGEIDTPLVYYAFDLLSAQGHDLRAVPLAARKEVLSAFAPRLGFVRYSDHVVSAGEALLEAARTNELEGIVAKKSDSKYESGRRSKSWLKIKLPRTALLAIVGYVKGKGSRGEIGSLLLAWRKDGKWVCTGAAGSGLNEETLAELRESLPPTKVAKPQCENVPQLAGLTFVEPKLACEVRYGETTSTGMLRHPVFVRMRPDIPLERCVAPADATGLTEPAPASVMVAKPAKDDGQPKLTRLEKVFWPVEGYTKGDLLGYYEAVWPWLAPYLRDRPLVLTRYPDGIEGKSFYQKNAPDFTPDWVTRQEIEGTDYFICNELRTLLYVINSGAIPLHFWHSRLQSLEHPDWLILDLDPKQAPFANVITIARHIHGLLDDLGVAHFAKTSGQAGLHVLIPLGGESLDHDDARQIGEVLARVVCADLPEIATITRPVAARGDKVYIDYLQNGRGKLIAGPFSVRPRLHAPVSMPLEWKQVNAKLDPTKFTIKTAVPRLEKSGDPLAGVLGPGVDAVALLGALAEKLAERLE